SPAPRTEAAQGGWSGWGAGCRMRLVRAREEIQLWDAVSRLVLDQGVDKVEWLSRKRERQTARCNVGCDRVVIVKIWIRKRGKLAAIASRWRSSTAFREWRIPNLLAARGIEAGRSFAYFQFLDQWGANCEAVV